MQYAPTVLSLTIIFRRGRIYPTRLYSGLINQAPTLKYILSLCNFFYGRMQYVPTSSFQT